MTQSATHLAGCLTGLREGVRLDEIADGFGLSEVELAGEKRALGEFAGFGQACAEIESTAQQQIQYNRRAVRGNLDKVVRGVGIGCGEEGDDGFVDAVGAGLARVGNVENIGEARPGMFEWMM
jgi:hypothetical protein